MVSAGAFTEVMIPSAFRAAKLGRLRTARGHPDGNSADRWGVELGSVRLVVGPFVCELLPVEETAHDLQSFAHPGRPFRIAGEGVAERSFVDVLAGSDAQVEAAIAESVECGGGLCHDAGVESEERCGNPGGEFQPVCDRRHRPDRREGEAGGAMVIHPGMEVLRHDHHVETRLLCEPGVGDELLGMPLLVSCEVGELGQSSS